MGDFGESDPNQIYQVVQRTELAGFNLCETVFPDETSVPAHDHPRAHLTLILKGGCLETYLGKTQTLAPRAVTYLSPGEPHALRVLSKKFRTFDIELDDAWMARISGRPIQVGVLQGYGNPSISWLANRLYREFKEGDDVSPLAMEGLVLEAMATLARTSGGRGSKRAPRWMNRVLETLQDEFARQISLSELASIAGVRPSRLAAVFREQYRTTVGDYIRKVRVERAIERMADPNATLADIALATGFSDQSHFSRAFKRETGMSPARYRRLLLDGN
jgi:AraC-like DNA-binding protein